MPAGNQTSTNSDYRVGDGPPPGNVEALMRAGAALSLTGGVLMLAACVWLDSKPLLWLGFGLSALGALLVFEGLRRLPPGLTKNTAKLRSMAAIDDCCTAEGLRSAGSGLSKAAHEACPAPAADSRYQLDAGQRDNCPAGWSADTWVTFYCRGTDEVLASVYLSKPCTSVVLKSSPALSPWGKPFQIEVS